MRKRTNASKVVKIATGLDQTILTTRRLVGEASGDDLHSPPSEPTPDQTALCGGAAKPKRKKLSMKESLDHLAKYRVRPSSLKSTAKLPAKGGKAEVFRASYKRRNRTRGKRVAVKKLRWGNETDKEKSSKELVHEVEVLAALSHENIVRLIGFVEDFKKDKAWIVLSWEPNGNVREFLASGTWEIPERISLIQDTFEGLKYLHTRQPPICHGDMKSLNILVSASYRAIITDFGSARAMSNVANRDTDQDTSPDAGGPSGMKNATRPSATFIASTNQLTLTGPAWSLRWAAPEVVKEEVQPGLPSDIWSAGWVCWEIMTDKLPFPDVYLEGPLTMRVVQGRVPSAREHAQLSRVLSLCSLMTDCWALDPKDRPTISRCSDQVKWMPSTPPGEMSLDPKTRSFNLSFEIGQIHYSQGCYENATKQFQQALAVAESTGDLNQMAEALEWLGDIDRLQSRFKDAEEHFVIVRDLYARTSNEKGQADTLWGLGDVYRLQCRFPEAVESFTKARDIYTLINDDRGRATTLRGLGDICCTQSKYTEAGVFFSEAQDIFVHIGDDQGRADVLGGLGNVYCAHSKFDDAAQFYIQAHGIYARIGDDIGLASMLDELGEVYIAQSNYSEAEKSFTEAQTLYVGIGDDQGWANTLRGLGDIHRARSQFKKSAKSYTLAQATYSCIGDRNGLARVLLSFGHLRRIQGRNDKAALFYATSRDLYAQIGCSSDEQRATHWLHVVLQRQDPSTTSTLPF
ncbi:hypothetical protein M407DRAFT_31404 [Tulasnella calospora MUT 4182]|uniref:Protein kinase domain-containing protein n=1 Tax=Tulasnella calospora MUT 4182 TaxID=1051891 RepID=A0A0C3Q6I2_9AGAM|nr:hypothetical protein M407DRAFT_31404 [Tulasnella calospora MUT 4182]